MLPPLTLKLEYIIRLANEAAYNRNEREYGLAHALLAILFEQSSIARTILQEFVNTYSALSQLRKILPPGDQEILKLPQDTEEYALALSAIERSPHLMHALERAQKLSQLNRRWCTDTYTFLYALLCMRDVDPDFDKLCIELNIPRAEDVKRYINTHFFSFAVEAT